MRLKDYDSRDGKRLVKYLIGFALVYSGAAYVAVADWPSMWSMQHFRAAFIGGALIFVGVAVMKMNLRTPGSEKSCD